MATKQTTLARLAREIAEQRRWIDDHGRNLSGYIERYGAKDDPDHYGDGGRAIYRADMNELQRLEQLYERSR